MNQSIEVKKYDPRQPRDDLGRWSTGSGGISMGHAVHVMRSEGITSESLHREVMEAIANGTHGTREDVLRHIDSIHAGNSGSTSDKPKAFKPGEPMSDAQLRAHQSEGHIAFVEDIYGSKHEIVQGKDGDYYAASNTNAIGTDGNRVGFRPAPLGLAADAILKAGATPSPRMKGFVEQHQANLFKITADSEQAFHRGRAIGTRATGAATYAVRKSIEEVDMTDTLISYGGAIKSLGETADAYKFGGYLVVFGSHDASNLKDKFTADTDFDIEDGDRRSVYYNHGLDGTIKKTKLGSATMQVKDAGVWIEGEIKKRQDYLKEHADKIIEGIKDGIFGLSSGAPAHLVEREKVTGGHQIKMWPIAEASITPTPAEPNTTCVSLKSLIHDNDAARLEGMAFPEHSQQSLEAVEEFHHRFHDWLSLRESSRKSGRLMSEDTYDWLNHHCMTMETLAATMRQSLDAHAPDAVKAEVIDNEILNAEIRMAELNARLHEVLNPI